jgi:hypothetical protein
MARNSRRDPYRNFNFRVLFGALGAVAAIALARKLFRKVERRYPGVYVEETSTGARPIEGVGTSTAGFVGTAPKRANPRRKS